MSEIEPKKETRNMEEIIADLLLNNKNEATSDITNPTYKEEYIIKILVDKEVQHDISKSTSDQILNNTEVKETLNKLYSLNSEGLYFENEINKITESEIQTDIHQNEISEMKAEIATQLTNLNQEISAYKSELKDEFTLTPDILKQIIEETFAKADPNNQIKSNKQLTSEMEKAYVTTTNTINDSIGKTIIFEE